MKVCSSTEFFSSGIAPGKFYPELVLKSGFMPLAGRFRLLIYSRGGRGRTQVTHKGHGSASIANFISGELGD